MQAYRRDVEKPWQLVRSGFHSVEHSAQDLFLSDSYGRRNISGQRKWSYGGLYRGGVPTLNQEKGFDKYVIEITVFNITVTAMTLTASSTFALQGTQADRAAAREQARLEMKQMSDAMVEEKGLLNHAQAALLLDVSTKRVGELVRLGKLTGFTFLGRKYVSLREIWERNTQELKAGRPPRRAADGAQASLGGYAGSYFKKKREEAKQSLRAEFGKKWHEIREDKKK